MGNENEVKSHDEVVSDAFDSVFGAKDAAQENSPENVQTVETPQNETGSVKTGNAGIETESNVPESVPYKRFQEINQKEKEARETLKQRDLEREQYSKLLDDPEVYAKWLKQQGYSDAHIQQLMAEKGYQAPRNSVEVDKSNQAQAIAEKACIELGWDIKRLNPEQKAYIQDSVNLTMKIIEQTVGPMLDKRFGPIEDMRQEMSMQKQFNAEEYDVVKLAKEEFPSVDFEEIIRPAISKFLKELDEKDPKRTIKLSYEDIYYRATRPLLRELNETKGRQDVRNINKANARPLGSGPASKSGEPIQKGANPRQELESKLDAMGIR